MHVKLMPCKGDHNTHRAASPSNGSPNTPGMCVVIVCRHGTLSLDAEAARSFAPSAWTVQYLFLLLCDRFLPLVPSWLRFPSLMIRCLLFLCVCFWGRCIAVCGLLSASCCTPAYSSMLLRFAPPPPCSTPLEVLRPQGPRGEEWFTKVYNLRAHVFSLQLYI
jgi:hypothetical protein